jgi:lysophospholipase L1-like esterase
VAKTVGFSAASTQYGVNANAARSTANGDQLTFSLPAGVSGFKVVSLGGSAVTGYNLNIDGGGAGATLGSPGSGSTTAGYVSPLQSVAPGSPHTVVLTTIGTNNYIFGLLVYAGNETKGIRVYNGAKHGSRAENYRFGGSYNWTLANETPTLLSGPQSIIPMDPHLIIVNWGINDYTSNSPDVTAAAYRGYIETIVAACRAMIPTRQIPVLTVGMWKPNAAQSGLGSWEEMRAARQDIPANDPLALTCEVGLAMPDIGSTQATQLALYADTLHANQKGYQMVADMIASLIAP